MTREAIYPVHSWADLKAGVNHYGQMSERVNSGFGGCCRYYVHLNVGSTSY